MVHISEVKPVKVVKIAKLNPVKISHYTVVYFNMSVAIERVLREIFSEMHFVKLHVRVHIYMCRFDIVRLFSMTLYSQ